MILAILLAISILANGALGYLLIRASKRLLQFDEIFEVLVDDVQTNITYLNKLTNTPILQNSPEILDAQKNMHIIRKRLDEIVLRMEETARRELRKEGTRP